MNNVTQRCISLANGTLSPDLRVDYQFGLVLGVSEFRQEQKYFLEKDYLHNRALHGYGTVSGLNVTAAFTTDDSKDVQITIEPGIALDQWGRPVVIRDKQCARLGAWLAKLEKQKPDEIANHLGTSGDLHLYVVVSYDECEDALVSIPGQPCSCGDAQQAPSRIRDSFNIQLCWEPPSMPAWDAVRCFARLMSHVHIVSDLPLNLSDEDTIIEHVRGLHLPCTDDLLGSQFFRLPAATARAALDRIFTVWVTEVHPKLIPNLIDPGTSEAGILLTRIDFTYDSTSKAITLLGASPDYTDDEGRPFLLHTQLIQELLLQGETAKPVREFAILQVRNAHTLRAWVHHPDLMIDSPHDPADWSQMLELKIDGEIFSIQDVSQDLDPAIFDVTITQFREHTETAQLIELGARVELTFKIGGFLVQRGDNSISLLDSITMLDFDYVGHDHSANTITVYAIAEDIPEIRELVTVNTVVPNDGLPYLSLKFQTDQPVRLREEIRIQQRVWNQDMEEVTFITRIAGTDSRDDFSYFWEIIPPMRINDRDFFDIIFDTTQIEVQDGDSSKSLASVIQEGSLSFVGYHHDGVIRVFYEVDIPPQQTLGPSIDEIITQVLAMPTQPFVTITPIIQHGIINLELWFHLSLDPTQNTVVIREPAFEVFAEMDLDTTPFVKTAPPTPPLLPSLQRNVFTITLVPGDWRETHNSPYLRFVFPIDKNIVSTPSDKMSLRDYAQKNHIKLEGFNGNDAILVYVRMPQQALG